MAEQPAPWKMQPVSDEGTPVSKSGNEHLGMQITLEDLKNMFKASIESEVVEMIWQDSNGKSEIALSFLSEMCPLQPSQVSSLVPNVNKKWSSLLVADPSEHNNSSQSVRPKTKPSNQKQIKCTIAENIKSRVKKRERILIIMRGVPGSGKSSLARKLQGNGVVLSTDDYFFNKRGEYYFDPRCLPEAHTWNQRRADRELKALKNPIVIDNTNLEAWEMEPYVCMALRCNYSVELIEPDTPWKNDARMLAQKNTHDVPRWKIEQMLEKQRMPIDMALVIENCRRKLNASYSPSESPLSQALRPANDLTFCQDITSGVAVPFAHAVADGIRESVNTSPAETQPSSLISAQSCTSDENSAACTSSDLPGMQSQTKGNVFYEGGDSRLQSEGSTAGALPILDATLQAIRPEKSEVAINEKGNVNENVDSHLETAQSKNRALSLLKSYFPALATKDLADILEQCKGDVTWAINVLLDGGYECADVVLETADLLEDEFKERAPEQLPHDDSRETSSETLKRQEIEALSEEQALTSGASGSSEETEALRRHIEECFQLTDTLSDRARRVCGKDYNEFRASQLQKLRHPQTLSQPSRSESTPEQNFLYGVPLGEDMPPLEASLAFEMVDHSPQDAPGATGFIDFPQNVTYQIPQPLTDELIEEEAMVPITLDPSLINQLVALFGPPDLHSYNHEENFQKSPATFEIPWSLAEQLYLNWCSNIVRDNAEEIPNEDEPNYEEDSEGRRLKNIMDIEYAMKLVEEEKNAELRRLRESLSTKLSRKMLEENYPQVDPLALEALFEANNYNYAHTVAALNASLETTPKANQKKETSSPSKPKPEVKPALTEVPEENRGYLDIRSEAFLYNQLRQQYAAKARENHQRGMASVAAYYASESRRYAELYKECSQKAAFQIVEKKNAVQDERTLDLHELHVTEALSCLESFIAGSLKDGKSVIDVITGRGNNSVNGRPRIKPAVVTFLKQKKYLFEEVNPGMLRIFIRRER